MRTLRIEIEGRANFHNVGAIHIRYTSAQIGTLEGVQVLILTPSQSRRLEKHFCGMSECTCGSGPQIHYDVDRTGRAIYCITDPFSLGYGHTN